MLLVIGVVLVIAGLFGVANPLYNLNLLIIVIGAIMVISGIFKGIENILKVILKVFFKGRDYESLITKFDDFTSKIGFGKFMVIVVIATLAIGIIGIILFDKFFG